mmetsp:Transcript_19495/g.31922  ORF Transcript_19495/g.31922 Transcript_19495/m.31922 type:complete len:121 (-) Transcript_19495:1812-2174(-)
MLYIVHQTMLKSYSVPPLLLHRVIRYPAITGSLKRYPETSISGSATGTATTVLMSAFTLSQELHGCRIRPHLPDWNSSLSCLALLHHQTIRTRPDQSSGAGRTLEDNTAASSVFSHLTSP